MWAWEYHRISPSCDSTFLAECHKRQLNQGSFVLLYFVSFHFYPRDAMLARVIAIAMCLSVCLSVRLSFHHVPYCVKTKIASGMISSPSGSPKTLVFWRQISSPNSKGFSPNGASKKGRSEKFSNFVALSVNISKTVADVAKVTISD